MTRLVFSAVRTFSIPALVLGFWVSISPAASAAEPDLRPEDLPHFPAVAPADAGTTFEIRPGFSVEIAAAEPEVVDPVAMSFDARGRAYVIEMRDYSERRPERLGRVRRLEDRDGDGRFETSVVFLDDLPWPTAITCWDDGVFVGSTPDILFARDSDGDGKADIRETVFTGFASDFAPYATNRLNVQAMLNSLQWGPDARIHGCGSMSGGKVRRVDSPFLRNWIGRWTRGDSLDASGVVDLRGRDFSFDPRALDLRAETGGGQHGMSFDDYGRKFLCSNSDHVQVARYEERYAARGDWFSPPPPRASISVDGPAAEVFRISPEEPWRVIRTRWRVTGLVQGLIEGGGRSSGYFTSATGITIYRGDAYGPDYLGDVFVADCGSNLIHRKKVRIEGNDLRAERPDDERRREFLASRDTWFRPVQFANAPDGCLWVLDMYREVIEHPWSIPPNLKRLIDLNSGSDRGRLHRIVPVGKPVRRQVDLASMSTKELVSTLQHPNGWHRDTASRLLIERQDRTAIPGLRATLRDTANASPSARFHALQVLAAFSVGNVEPALDVSDLEATLRDPSTHVRQSAVRALEFRYHGHDLPIQLVPHVAALALTSDPTTSGVADVRLQVAFTLGSIRHPARTELLASLLRSARPQAGESLIFAAALSSAGDDASALFQRLARGQVAPPDPVAALAEIIGRRNRSDETTTAIALLGSLTNLSRVLDPTLRLAEGLRASGNSLAVADSQRSLSRLYTEALRAAASGEGLPEISAIRLLAHLPADLAEPALLKALTPRRSSSAQQAAVDVLLTRPSDATLNAILDRWPDLTKDAQARVLDVSLRRPSGTRLVLEALAARRVPASSISAAQLNGLRAHSDPGIRARALELLGAPAANRHDAVAAMLPSLSLTGDVRRGLEIHQAQCAPCHRLGGQGHALGPDLESVRSQPKEKLLVAILDPNREVQPAYLASTAETTDGETVTGVVASETASELTLRLAGGIQSTLPRTRIARLKPEGRSLMPEGFESTLNAQQLADLLAVLTGTP